ncbi:MAG: glycine cleavage system aminomethyltransferase GcvT [bacterium]
MDEDNHKKTALHDAHIAAGAKIIPFAGFLMPIQYSGIVSEHRRVRTTAGVFDVSHMGEFEFRRANAEKFLNWITINDVSKLAIGQVQYSAMCYPDGGIVDDLLVYRFEDHYMMVVNAANLAKDKKWILQHLPTAGVEFQDVSDEITLLAIQGPRSLDIVSALTARNVAALEYYHFALGEVSGIPAIISRTGYTGELGYELYINHAHAEALWDAVMRSGKAYDIEPIGLGARDTLRLEMKYCLYGNDIDATTNPLEAGLGWIMKLRKGDFIGRDALLAAKEDGIRRKLVGFEMLGKGIPRHGVDIYSRGEKVGQVTSGNFSPMLERGIGLGYVPVQLSDLGVELELEMRSSRFPIRIVETPFYRPTTA